MQHHPGGTFTATAATLRDLVRQAYGIEGFQVEGAQGWIGSDRYEVIAKLDAAPEKLAAEESRRMLQDMLADRFRLKVHRESRETSIYTLEIGKGGPRLKALEGYPKAVPSGEGTSVVRATTVAGLASFISSLLQRVVVDDTKLQGDYDIALTFSPDFAVGPIQPASDAGPSPTEPRRGPSLSAALQEQLGLKLQSRKGPAEFIVIDQAERPSAN
jgi:uncharacterized protein (TIGR03435 family)